MLVWQAEIYYCAQTCICNYVVSAQPRYQRLSFMGTGRGETLETRLVSAMPQSLNIVVVRTPAEPVWWSSRFPCHQFIAWNRLRSLYTAPNKLQSRAVRSISKQTQKAGKITRVRTGHGKPGKSWNFRISFSRPGKSWNLGVGHGKSLKMMFIKKYKINCFFFAKKIVKTYPK